MTQAANLAASGANMGSTGKLSVAGINATGTADSTTYLRGDGSWSTAGASTTLYDIGTYITGRPANSSTYAVNSTVAGSSLYATGSPMVWNSGGFFSHGQSGNAASSDAYTLINTGSWRCVSPGGQSYASASAYSGLWVRYA